MNLLILALVIFTTLLVSCSADPQPCTGLFCKAPSQKKRDPRPGSTNRSDRYKGANQRKQYVILHQQSNDNWCERLEPPEHGQILPITKNRFQPGESMTYKCPMEHRLFGHTHRTCRKDGTWSGRPAYCRAIDCGTPVIPNGNATLIEGQSRYRSVAHIRCNNRPEITRLMTCDRHGIWKPRIHCRRKKPIGLHLCKNPHLSRCRVEKSIREHSLLFRPGESQHLFGNTTSTCLRTGQWYPELPKCYNNCLTPVIRNSRNISVNWNFTHGRHLRVECLDGYVMSGQSTMKCSDGHWKPSVPSCSPIVRMHYLQEVRGSASQHQMGPLLSLYVLVPVLHLSDIIRD